MSEPAADQAEALLARGVERYAAGDVQGAAALFREAAALRPDDERALAYLAWTEVQLAVEQKGAEAAAGDLLRAAGASTWSDDDTTREREPTTRPREPSTPIAGGASLIRRLAAAEHDGGGFEIAREITLPWHPSVDRSEGGDGAQGSVFRGAEAPVRRFLSRTPTRPNLLPLDDVHVLSEERVHALAAGLRRGPLTSPWPAVRPSLVRELESAPLPARSPHDTLVQERPAQPPSAPAPAPAAPGEPDALPPLPVEPDPPRAPADADLPALVADWEQELGDRARLIQAGPAPADLDPRSYFLLSRVDGTFSIEDLLDISGMERAAACRIVALLLRRGALVPVR